MRPRPSSILVLLLPALLLSAVPAAPARGQDPPEESSSPGPVRIAAVGDIMMGTAWPEGVLPPDDGHGIFRPVEDAFRGRDVVFGNLEGPLLDEGEGGKCEKARNPALCYAFRMPTRYVRHLRDAGFHAVGVANNHASDYGRAGILGTVAVLEEAGIRPVGGEKVAVLEVRGRRVAIAGFSYSPPSPFTRSILDIPEAERFVAALAKEYDLVLVSFHGGAEGKAALHLPDGEETFAGERRGDLRRFARAVIDAGADAVLGHGPHVPRAIEVYRGKLVAYSLGNFLTYAMFNLKGPSGIGYVLQADLDPGTGNFLAGRIVPVELRRRGLPFPDGEGKAIALIRQLTEEDIRNPCVVIRPDGAILLAPDAGDCPGAEGP